MFYTTTIQLLVIFDRLLFLKFIKYLFTISYKTKNQHPTTALRDWQTSCIFSSPATNNNKHFYSKSKLSGFVSSRVRYLIIPRAIRLLKFDPAGVGVALFYFPPPEFHPGLFRLNPSGVLIHHHTQTTKLSLLFPETTKWFNFNSPACNSGLPFTQPSRLRSSRTFIQINY